jgi:hypothetical protein
MTRYISAAVTPEFSAIIPLLCKLLRTVDCTTTGIEVEVAFEVVSVQRIVRRIQAIYV